MRESKVPFSHPWPEKLLGSVAKVVVGGTPSTAIDQYWGGPIPWMASGDIHLGRIFDVPGRITEAGLNGSNAVLVEPDAVAMALAGQGKTRGTVALTKIKLCTNQSVALISPHPDELLPEYLYQSLIPRYDELRSRSAGGGRGGLTKAILEQIPVQLPSLGEQRRIAEVLSALDEQIDWTEAVIHKLNMQRKGLAADLLTCRHLSASEIADVRLAEVIPTVQYGISSSLTEAGAIPVLRMNNLSGGEIDVSDLKYSPTDVPSDLYLKPGDVLFNRTNSMEHVGRTSLWRGQLTKCTFASYLVRLSPDSKRLLPEYLVYLLEWEENQLQMRKYATPGVQQVNINPTSLRRCRVQIPKNLDAQRKTVAALDAARENIEALKEEVAKLKLQKQGLMRDLLTGAVRVTEGN